MIILIIFSWMSWTFITVGLGLTIIVIFVYCQSDPKKQNVQVINPVHMQNNVKLGDSRSGSLIFDINPLRPAQLPTSID